MIVKLILFALLVRFKLHMRPDDMVSRGIPALPRIRNTSIVKIFADFLQYMYQCAKNYIQETPTVGPPLWNSLQDHIEYIFTHPNGWGGAQQSQMRRAAVLANLIPDTHQGHDRVQFVTEGEASLHFCIQSGIGEETTNVCLVSSYLCVHDETYPICAWQAREGIIIVDAGGGTIDLSAYVLNTSSGTASYEEIAPPECEWFMVYLPFQRNALLMHISRSDRRIIPCDRLRPSLFRRCVVIVWIKSWD